MSRPRKYDYSQLAALVAQGLSNRQIGERLGEPWQHIGRALTHAGIRRKSLVRVGRPPTVILTPRQRLSRLLRSLFLDDDRRERWLATRNHRLDGRSPNAVLAERGGTTRVLALLEAMTNEAAS